MQTSTMLATDHETPTWQASPFREPREAERIAELEHALETEQLVVYYQPVVELRTGRVVGVEALVRWLHPEVGLISPDRFLGLAEESGVLREITSYVLDCAAAQHTAWRATGLDLSIAINLSACSLRDPKLVERTSQACRAHGVEHRNLTLEITEAAVMADPDIAAVALDELATRGFNIAIDDFGTGLASLSYLRNLPVTLVKIDRAFVPNIAVDEADAHIVRGLIEISHGLGKQVVAEGVENGSTHEILRFMGCEFAQGYYWTRPLPAEQLTDALAHVVTGAPTRTAPSSVGETSARSTRPPSHRPQGASTDRLGTIGAT